MATTVKILSQTPEAQGGFTVEFEVLEDGALVKNERLFFGGPISLQDLKEAIYFAAQNAVTAATMKAPDLSSLIGQEVPVESLDWRYASLEVAQDFAKTQLDRACQRAVFYKASGGDRYPTHLQVSFTKAASKIEWALDKGTLTTEQEAIAQDVLVKLQSVEDWINSVLAYYYQKKNEIFACTTAKQVKTMDWDFTQFEITDPDVSLSDVWGRV